MQKNLTKIIKMHLQTTATEITPTGYSTTKS